MIAKHVLARERPDGRIAFYWKPSATLRKLGFKPRALGIDYDSAKQAADELNREAAHAIGKRTRNVRPRGLWSLLPVSRHSAAEVLREGLAIDDLRKRRRRLEPISAVYFLFSGEELVYVGQATDVAAKIIWHQMADPTAFDSYVALPYPAHRLKRCQQRLIAFHKPKLNATAFDDLPDMTVTRLPLRHAG